MDEVTSIKTEEFKKLYNVKEIDLVKKGLFTQKDFEILEKQFGYLRFKDRIIHFIKDFPALLRNPKQILKIADQIILNQIKDIKRFSTEKEIAIKDRYPISDYILKASIAASFKPKNMLEIGTFRGWGTASLKMASPNTIIYTMNPKENADANNPISEDRIGEVYKKKKLKIHQIWADSTKYNYSKFPLVDITYIDGNHDYEFVYKDLQNTSPITKKAIILDDYIPSKNSPRGGVRAWGPWNESVVAAVDTFLKDNPKIYKKAYWLEDSPICILIK